MEYRNQFLIGHVLDRLKDLPDCCIQTAITSPPYFGLRDYGTAEWEGGDSECDHIVDRFSTPASEKQKRNKASGLKQARSICPKCGAKRVDNQIGLEETIDEYVKNLVIIFREMRRCMRDNGTFWLNLGDSYYGGKGVSNFQNRRKSKSKSLQKDYHNIEAKLGGMRPLDSPQKGLKQKDLVGIPWRVAFALQADGWYLRSDIIWAKGCSGEYNGGSVMPSSVKDRCSSAHEHIFMFAKNKNYYYDNDSIKDISITVPHLSGRKNTSQYGEDNGNRKRTLGINSNREWAMDGKRNRRSVWVITTKPYKGSHFATFPPKLVELCVKAGTSQKGACPFCEKPSVRQKKVVGSQVTSEMRHAGCDEEGKYGGQATKDFESSKAQNASDTKRRILDSMSKIIEYEWKPGCDCGFDDTIPCVVLDPFVGSGTTAWVAKSLGRDYIGIDLNGEYIETLAKKRVNEKPYDPTHARKPSPDFAWLSNVKGLGTKGIFEIEDQFDGDILAAIGNVDNWNVSKKVKAELLTVFYGRIYRP